MHRHAWRWLWIWVGVLVAGCGQLWSSNGTPSPSREPTRPLLDYTLLPPTLWPITATPLITADGAGSLPSLALYLTVAGPKCYTTPVGSLVCLGRVVNPLDRPVERVTVGVQLFGRDGRPLALQEAVVARAVIPPHGAGPYRVIFEKPANFTHAQPIVTSAQPAPVEGGRVVELALRQVAGAFVRDQYQVTVSISNPSPAPVDRIAVTMTLLNGSDEVTGFREMALDPARQLGPGESLVLTMTAIPQGEKTVGFEAFAEGYRVE